jgi:hypothetical protein
MARIIKITKIKIKHAANNNFLEVVLLFEVGRRGMMAFAKGCCCCCGWVAARA